MKLVDVNVLLYAVNREAAHHSTCLKCWESALSGRESIGLAWAVLLAFLRVSTKSNAFVVPLSPTDALERIETWLDHPNTRVVQEPEEHFLLMRQLIEQCGTAGNLTSDAHLAALAISSGATLVSCDTDFARFAGLRWENPLA
jgi:uncharacterized protein